MVDNNICTFYLKKFRAEAKLGIFEAAKRMGISVSYLSDMETGRRIPSKRVTQLIIDTYGLSDLDKRNLYDAIGVVSNSVPYDVEEFLVNNNSALQNVIGMMYEKDPKFGSR